MEDSGFKVRQIFVWKQSAESSDLKYVLKKWSKQCLSPKSNSTIKNGSARFNTKDKLLLRFCFQESQLQLCLSLFHALTLPSVNKGTESFCFILTF
jgi:hypothetical protein